MMNSMNFPMQYPPNQGVAITQIVKRPLTDGEMQLGIGYYKKVQTGLRGLAVISIVLFAANGYLLSGLSDPVLYDSMSLMLTIFMLVIGLAAVGMSANTVSVRKKVTDVMRDETAIEVSGPAYMSRAVRNVPSWTIGPVSLVSTKEVMGLLQEGAQTSILCLPRLKVAVAINNYGLKQGARITFPPNLEAMAIPSNPAPIQQMMRPYESLGVIYQPPTPQK